VAEVHLFTLVCPVILDSDGNHIAGCGKGWESTNRTEACTGCGMVGKVIDVTFVQPV
jgi:hypothetical protein